MRETVQVYRDTFPNHKCASWNTYAKVIKNFHQTASIVEKYVRTKIINNERNKGIIVAKVNENAYVSLR